MKKSNSIRVLGIAPYDGMKNVMLKAAEDFSEIDLTVHIGDMDEGVSIAKENFHGNYDVIISRGGTARLLEKQVSLPIIEVEITAYDMLRALRLSGGRGKRAIVGYPNVTENAYLLRELLQGSFDVFTISDPDEVSKTLSIMRDLGYDSIICDVAANMTAAEIGLRTVLITSGTESIKNAFSRAVEYISMFSQLKEENRFLRSIISGQLNHTAVFDENDMLYFSSLPPDTSAKIIELLRNELPNVPREGSLRIAHNLNGNVYTIRCQQLHSPEKSWKAFYFSSAKTPLSSKRSGITYFDRNEVRAMLYDSFYAVAASDGSVLGELMQSIAKSGRHTLIYGETGTGKKYVAAQLYAESSYSKSPLIMIDCAMLNNKTWDFLINHHVSPFNDIGSTIYIRGLLSLPAQKYDELYSAIFRSGVAQHNRLLISCVSGADGTLNESAALLSEQLSCITLRLPPIREYPEKIPALVGLRLNTLDVSTGSQIVDIAEEGMELLKSFSWPHNYLQFRRVIDELASVSNAPQISAESVRSTLKKEPSMCSSVHNANEPAALPTQVPIKLSMTLAELEMEIVNRVLEDCGQNQTAAAKRLGISRTTLWRLIKNC